MKYTVSLRPGGVVPRDPDMKLRLRRSTEAETTTVTNTETVTIVQTNSFLDRYNTGTSLDDHLPDAGGGAYSLRVGSPGALTDCVVTTSLAMGNVAGDAVQVQCDMVAPPDLTAYSFEIKFTVTDCPDGEELFVEGILNQSSPNAFPMFVFLDWAPPSAPELGVDCYDASGSPIVGILETLSPLSVGQHTILVTLSASGTAVSFDGAAIASDPAFSDAVPDRFQMAAFCTDGAAGSLDSVRVYSVE